MKQIKQKKIFWKIRNNADIILSLKYLKVNESYLKLILEDDSEFDKYIKTNPEYVCISYTIMPDFDYNGFGWFEGEEEDINFMISKGYIFKGEVNFRKEKLLKLNGKFRENT